MSPKKKTKSADAEPEPLAFRIETPVQDDVLGVYINHATMQSREDEALFLNLYQLPGLGVDVKGKRIKACLAGSYVMRSEFAEALMKMLAQNLGYEVQKRGASNDAT